MHLRDGSFFFTACWCCLSDHADPRKCIISCFWIFVVSTTRWLHSSLMQMCIIKLFSNVKHYSRLCRHENRWEDEEEGCCCCCCRSSRWSTSPLTWIPEQRFWMLLLAMLKFQESDDDEVWKKMRKEAWILFLSSLSSCWQSSQMITHVRRNITFKKAGVLEFVLVLALNEQHRQQLQLAFSWSCCCCCYFWYLLLLIQWWSCCVTLLKTTHTHRAQQRQTTDARRMWSRLKNISDEREADLNCLEREAAEHESGISVEWHGRHEQSSDQVIRFSLLFFSPFQLCIEWNHSIRFALCVSIGSSNFHSLV